MTSTTCAVHAAAGAGYLNASRLFSIGVSMTRNNNAVDVAAGAGPTERFESVLDPVQIAGVYYVCRQGCSWCRLKRMMCNLTPQDVR